jgi:MFS family permease
VRERLVEPLRAFRAVFTNRNLRRIQLAGLGSTVAGWAYGIALSVYAYHHGGATAVGYVNILRWIPSAAVGPFMAILADRFPRKLVMLAADVIRAAALAGATVAFYAHAPAAAIYALAVFVSIVGRAFAPAERALLPSLVETPEELTAANVTASTIESVGLFLGPALGGLLLAATDAGVVFATMAVAFLWSAFMVVQLRVAPRPTTAAPADEAEPAAGFRDEALAGVRAITSEEKLRIIVGLFTGQVFVDGLLNVLVVVLAFRLLKDGASAVGYLNSAIGIGGLLGAVFAIGLVGRRRLAGGFALGMLLWGTPIIFVALWPNRFFAIAMLALVGVGNTLIDVSGMTLMQRTVVDEVLARAFGVLESLVLASVAIGSIVAPAIVAGLGARGALFATGAILPIITAFAWRRLQRIDETAVIPEQQVALLRGIPIFAPLPEATVEHLGSRLAPMHVAAGTTVIREGDRGDRFYIVSEGGLEAQVDGQPARELGPGSYFGEIALLRDVPRTATVTAREDSELFALEREDFIAAVTGHADSRDAAEAVVVSRLGSARASIGSL